jgi:hypothetical protein
MMQILIAFLNTQAGQDLAVGILTSGVAVLARAAEKSFLANKRAAPLAILPEIAAKAVDDGIKAAAGAHPNQRMALAIAAARAELVAQFPTIEKIIGGELTALVAGHVALQTVAPGNTVVNLPDLKGI